MGGSVTVKKVLIADDDPALRGLLRVVAARAGFGVDIAVDGVDALEKLGRTQYAVAVIDLMMPRKSGYDVIEHVRELKSKPAVIVVTAMDDAHIQRLDGRIVTSILRKPFDVETLCAVLLEVAEAIAGARSDHAVDDDEGNVIEFPQTSA